MHLTFTSEPRDNDGVTERDFALDEIPGILWTPEPSSTPAPLILLGHPGDLRRMHPRLAARARRAAADGFAAATIELPGGGGRRRFRRITAPRCSADHRYPQNLNVTALIRQLRPAESFSAEDQPTRLTGRPTGSPRSRRSANVAMSRLTPGWAPSSGSSACAMS